MPRPTGEADSPEHQQPRYFTRGRLSRGKGLRKTTGCLTCRRRHVKCDEVKPRCGGCNRKMVPCLYANQRESSKDEVSMPCPRVSHSSPSTNVDHESALDNASACDASDELELLSPRDRVVAPSQVQVTGLHYEHEHGCHEMAMQQTQDDGTTQRERVPQQQDSSMAQNLQVAELYSHSQEAPWTTFLSPYSSGPPITGISEPSTTITIESPTARWLDLLIADATVETGALPDFDDESGVNVFGNAIVHMPDSNMIQGSPGDGEQAENNPQKRATRNPSLQERIFPLRSDQIYEKQAWHSSEPVQLLDHEHVLFRHFVQHISTWMDLFEPKRLFGTFIPHLALHNVGLINAILALSARHLSLVGGGQTNNTKEDSDYNDGVGYYYRTLHYSQKAMQYDTYKTSLELLAISIIVSTYEMLDGSSTDWERHLKGVFWIQRSQVIHGDSGGLRQAVWWAWLCQDVWAAFREKRKPLTFWKPERTLDELDPSEVASRSVYNFAQAVSFCSKEDITESNLVTRMSEADELMERLHDWHTHLTVEFEAFPSPPTASLDEPFPPVWIHPPAFAIAMQMYYCSLIIVHLHRPLVGGVDEYLKRQGKLRRYSKAVCGIASTLTDYASSIMSSQCVFIAGISLVDSNQRRAVLKLLETMRQRAAWPAQSLGDELSMTWKTSDDLES